MKLKKFWPVGGARPGCTPPPKSTTGIIHMQTSFYFHISFVWVKLFLSTLTSLLLEYRTTLSSENVGDMANASALVLLLASTIGMLFFMNPGRVQGNPIGQVDGNLQNLRGRFVVIFKLNFLGNRFIISLYFKPFSLHSNTQAHNFFLCQTPSLPEKTLQPYCDVTQWERLILSN